MIPPLKNPGYAPAGLANKHWESNIATIDIMREKGKKGILFHVLQLLSYFKTLFETKPFMCCVRIVKYQEKIYISFHLTCLCFFLSLFPFVVSHVVVLILPMSFCVQHVLDNGRIYVETNQY